VAKIFRIAKFAEFANSQRSLRFSTLFVFMELRNGAWLAILTLAAPTGWEGRRRVWRKVGVSIFAQYVRRTERQLHDLDQSLWLDNITRDLPSSRRLKQRIDELSVTNRTTAIRVPDRRNSL